MSLKCKMCDEISCSRNALVKHYKIVHGPFISRIPLPCVRSNCSSLFLSVKSWNNHRSKCKLSFQKKNNFFNCISEFCGQKFINFALLLKHMKQHMNACQPVTCPFEHCSQKFTVKICLSS